MYQRQTKRELLATYQRRVIVKATIIKSITARTWYLLKRPKNGRDGSAEEKPWQDIKVQEKLMVF